MFDLSPETQEKILIIIITTIVSGIVSFIVGRYVGRKNLRYQNFLSTSAEFRDVFIDMQIFLDESDKSPVFDKISSEHISVCEFIERNIKTQENVFIRLEPHLWFIKRRCFRKVWEDYANPKDKNPIVTLNKSASLNRYVAYNATNPSEEREKRKLVRKKMKKLLKFAKVR